ncbi:MAG: phenylalanine--tRNA ligase subunit alpha [Elusimicrobiota bacterium]|jgi:phenylalanyl-tRNA synthetase alpha chain|nr:phenylalanine--tRNA ligase subunit alpha [Elusimicrobiota bacterium]
MELKEKLDKIRQSFNEKIEKVENLEDLEKIRIEFFGKKSEVIEVAKNIKNFSESEKPLAGKYINELKNELLEIFENKKNNIDENKKDIQNDLFDISVSGKKFAIGNLHPITKVMREVVEIFERLGFGIAEGPDIESDYYNFTALNFPEEHPARDMQDTFFLDAFDKDNNKPFLLRTHTSPVQIRFMNEHSPPFQIISPGSVYRCDSDVSHSPMFHQVEGLAIGENITFANLKWVLIEFIHKMFGIDIKARFRPSFFPFTEPSVEVDMSCVICSGKGCRICKNTGWLEILGAGMVHTNVLNNVGYDIDKMQGFAFGMGIERIAMIKYQVNDIRLFFENDIRFLKQF